MRCAIIVPCYNEGERLSDVELQRLLDLDPELDLLLVDDGSTDDTAQRLASFAAPRSDRVRVLELATNCGKGEAVRSGLLRACELGYELTGYLDADMATPPEEMVRLLRIARAADKDVVLGARVALQGRAIERSFVRHLLGRVFATGASLVLGASLYDTQCGAKVLRVGPPLRAALEREFSSRWAFDVELLGRLLRGSDAVPAIGLDRIVEEPLMRRSDVPGSKLRLRHMVRVAAELPLIARTLRR